MFIIKDNRKSVKRKAVTFKISQRNVTGRRKVKKPVSNPNEGRANLSQRHIDAVQAKNNQMAEALNQAKIQNGVLKGQIKTLHSENLELRVENATQRDEMRRQQASTDVSLIQRQAEQELHQKLQLYLEPMMKSLNQALDHTMGLSNNLQQTMQFATALDKKSKSMRNSPTKSSVPLATNAQSSPFSRLSPSKQQDNTFNSNADLTRTEKRPASSVAQILPMVKGHHISQPKIKMSRVLMSADEIEALRVQHSRGRVEAPELSEPPSSNTNSEEDEDDDGEQNDVTSRQQRQRQLRMRNLERREPVADLSVVAEEEEEEEDEDSDDEAEDEDVPESRTVAAGRPRLVLDLESVLIPRLVLDRVAIPTETSGAVRASPVGKRRRSSPVKLRVAADSEAAAKRRRRRLSRTGSGELRVAPPHQDNAVMSPRVVIKNDAHQLLSKINGSVPSTDSALPNISSCDSRTSRTSNEEQVNLCDWNNPSTPDESGVDVNLDEEESSSSSSGGGKREKAEQKLPPEDSDEDDDDSDCALTPGGSGETQREFLERVMALDPMEGPSWLYDENNRKRRGPPKAKKVKPSEKGGGKAAEVRTVHTRSSGGEAAAAPPPPTDAADSASDPTEEAKGDPAPDVSEHESDSAEGGPSADEPPRSSSGSEQPASSTSSGRGSDGENAGGGDTRGGGAPRRRAAAAAVGSLKEQPTNTKLRQGDRTSSSIYKDFVPGTKPHAGTSTNKRASTATCGAPAAKRQSLNKKRSK